MTEPQRFETLALHAGIATDPTLARGVPVHRSSSYLFRSTEHAAGLFALKEIGNIYSRIQNPTQDVLEKRMAALEGGAAALALASGTSAIFYTIINVCGHGDEVVSSAELYGGTFTMFHDILPELGVRVRFTESLDPGSFEKLINDRTRLVFAETIGNPLLNVTDIAAVGAVAHKHGLPLAVDSTFTTPYLLRPIEHGADIVVHSLTKWLGGHGTGIGGIVVDSGRFDWKQPKFRLYNEPDAGYHGLRFAHDLGALNPLAFILRMRLVPLRNLGACISPDNAWMFLQGIETIALRMQRHCDNALAVARWLKDHDRVAWVRYPGLSGDPAYPAASRQLTKGFGGVVVFGVKGGDGRRAGERFIDSLRLVSHLANVGDAKSLAIHPASTTHSQLTEEQLRTAGVSGDMVRLSVGIEHRDDIIADLGQALEQSSRSR